MSADGAPIEGWKAIAAALHRDQRTVMRWETTRALPIHRSPGDLRSAVFVFRAELDQWTRGVDDLLLDATPVDAASIELVLSV